MTARTAEGRKIARWVLAAIYALVGVLHLYTPESLMPMMPGWVPFPRQVILITGVCEIAGAIGLMTHRFRQAAAIALALYAICVFPANIKAAMQSLSARHMSIVWLYHVPRLAFQPVLIWWPLFASMLTDWPLGDRRVSSR